MNVLEYIQREIAGVRRSIDGTMKDMNEDLFNWAPPGTANTISATFVHFLHSEDFFIQTIIQGKPEIWESGQWSEKTGVSKPPLIGEDWNNFKHQRISIQPLLEYQSAVRAATDAYLSTLTPEELDRNVKFAGGERTVADMLLLACSHSSSHNGEIAALKGIQGAKGLPV
ncbi:MAG: DinB family protein [Pelolinea sp.]|nr:DinB family protein [Pelolinea sp.]